jgi:3-hydroxyisobutyrate dehydrogenase-like beta-hydroxyacid dehydrogenase
MGHAVGQRLRENELRAITCLTGRSERTRALAEKAGIQDVPDFQQMVKESDMILSMTVSAAVPELCRQVAEAIRATQADVLFAECNAIAPQQVRDMEPIITEAGGRFVDVSIIGGPPRPGYSPHFYTSGVNASEFAQLGNFGLDVRTLDGPTGQASGIKMCYAAMTKGSWALYSELLMAAELMGLTEPLLAEFQGGGQSSVYQRMEGTIPTVPARSQRWVSEMEEIKATFEHLGMTPHIFQGVADMYRLIGSSPLAEENPEDVRGEKRDFREVIRQLAEAVKPNQD